MDDRLTDHQHQAADLVRWPIGLWERSAAEGGRLLLYVRAMVPSLAFLPSPLLGPSVWQPVAQVLADRGWHTVICAASRSLRTGQDVLDAFLAALPMDRELVLIPHSNAGAYVPALTTQRRIVAAVFVDAVLPPGRGRVPLAPPAFLDLLREKADGMSLATSMGPA